MNQYKYTKNSTGEFKTYENEPDFLSNYMSNYHESQRVVSQERMYDEHAIRSRQTDRFLKT